tara:strand:+ start:335 stop:799 length:465 start_codon:yes stop_codon:yes gene_type:complete
MNDSTKDSNVITSDQPLTSEQAELLSSLLNVIIPPSDDGVMPGAGELDLVSYLREQTPEVVATIRQASSFFEFDFPSKSATERHQLVVEFSVTEPEMFNTLLFQSYACYYQNDRVLTGLGLAAGPPFPRGNSVDSGDLTTLDKVVQNAKGYRRV